MIEEAKFVNNVRKIKIFFSNFKCSNVAIHEV